MPKKPNFQDVQHRDYAIPEDLFALAEEVRPGADVIIDGLDNFETRYLLNDVADKLVAKGEARHVDVAQATEILKKANDHGLVHPGRDPAGDRLRRRSWRSRSVRRP